MKLIFRGLLLMLLSCSAFAQTLHMIGDSTMAIKKAEDYPETGWGQVLGVLAGKTLNIHNYAVNGRSTRSFIDEGRWDAAKVNFKAGDFLLIQFGHNDAKNKDPKRFTVPFGSYKENLTRFVIEARAAGVQPVLATSIVRRKFTKEGVLKDTHKDYLVAVRGLASELKVPLVDMEALTRSLVLEFGVGSSKGLYVHGAKGELANYPDGVADDTHLSEMGALKVAQLFVQDLKSSGHPLGLLFTNN